MDLESLLSELRAKQYRRIMVTGPQRSGTTIAAKILAEELGFAYRDEGEILVGDVGAAFRLYDLKRNFVLQAPALAAYCHLFPGAVVFMARDLEEIRQSQIRIAWNSSPELEKYFLDKGEIAKVKYQVWEKWQKKLPGRYELEYVSLASHRLWVPSHERKDFSARQTERS